MKCHQMFRYPFKVYKNQQAPSVNTKPTFVLRFFKKYFYFPSVRFKKLQEFVDKKGLRYTDEICLHEKQTLSRSYLRKS